MVYGNVILKMMLIMLYYLLGILMMGNLGLLRINGGLIGGIMGIFMLRRSRIIIVRLGELCICFLGGILGVLFWGCWLCLWFYEPFRYYSYIINLFIRNPRKCWKNVQKNMKSQHTLNRRKLLLFHLKLLIIKTFR